MNKQLQSHVAIFTANVIFGLGVPATKLLLEEWVTPMSYMATRCIGAALIFWIISLFMPRERVERKDLLVIMGSGLLGFVVSQTLTAWALNFTSPVYFSLIAALTPVATMLMAFALGQDALTWDKPVAAVLVLLGAWMVTKK